MGAPAPTRVVERVEDWGIYAYRDDTREHCYLASRARSKPGAGRQERRVANASSGARAPDTGSGRQAIGEIWVLVSNEPLSGIRNTISLTFGKALDPAREVRARIGRKVFSLVARGDTAWTRDDDTNLRLLIAMKRGRRLVVSARAADGKTSLTTFSLMGFTRILREAGERCRL